MTSVREWTTFAAIYGLMFLASCAVVTVKLWMYVLCCRCCRRRSTDDRVQDIRFPPPKLQERVPSRNSVFLHTVDGHPHHSHHHPHHHRNTS